MASESKWYGDAQDGIEVRTQEGEIDEILLHRNGECCVHIEQMSDTHYWMSLTSERHEVHANIGSKGRRAHVVAHADGWTREQTESPKQ